MCSTVSEFVVSLRTTYRLKFRPSLMGFAILCLWLIPLDASAQLSETDKDQIRVEAEKVVRELKELMDMMATKRGGSAYCRQVREANTDESNESRIFLRKESKIEDDVDPRYIEKVGAGLKASSYLYRIEQNFLPSRRSNPVEFDRIQTFEVNDKGYAYAKVYFRTKFVGSYRPTGKSNYIRNKRTAELIAEKDASGSWRVYIDNIRFASNEDISSIYGGSEGLFLVKEIEEAQEKLKQEQRQIEQAIGSLLAKIDAVGGEGTLSDQKIEDTREKAIRLAREADSLAKSSYLETDQVKRSMSISKLKAETADSLSNEFAAQVNTMRRVAASYANMLDSVKRANGRVQTYLSDAELAYYIVDTLVTVMNPRAPLDEIMNSYYNASGVAKNAENSSQSSLRELDVTIKRLNSLKDGKEQSQTASKRAYEIQQTAQDILNDSRGDQLRVDNANRRAELLLAEADTAIIKLDGLLGPLANGPQPLINELLKTQIEDDNYRFQSAAKDATDLAKALNEAAISTDNKALIKEAAIVVELAGDLYEMVDDIQPRLDDALKSMQNDVQISSKTESILDTIIQRKNAALASIRQARQSLNRTRYNASGTDRIIESAKNKLARVTKEKQEAIAANQSADNYITLVERELQSVKEAYAKTDRFSKDANENVNQAYSKVAKRSVEQRRHYTPYLGINYTGFRSSSRNLGQSPIFEGFGMDRIGFSLYYRIGAFFSNYGGFSDEIPEAAYRMDDLENEFQAMTGQTGYRGANLVQSGANLRHYNAGVYLSPFRHFYVKAGYTFVRGTTWDYFDAPELAETNLLKAPGTSYFALNKSTVNTGAFLFGVAAVWPYAQAEIGYNSYFDDIFVNFGINVPLRQTYTLKSTRTISRDEYDELMMEWKKNKR